jgi:hypothetical protein
MAEPADYIQNQGQHHAENNRCGEWEVKSRIIPAIEEIPGQSPDGQAAASKKQEEQAQHQQHCAKENEKFANVGHFPILNGTILHLTKHGSLYDPRSGE